MNITVSDAHAYSRGRLSVEDVAVRENTTLETARAHIYAHLKTDRSRSRRKWTAEDKAALLEDLKEAVKEYGEVAKAVNRWGLSNISHALGVLGIKSLDELRFGANVGAKLRPYRLKLVGNELRVLRSPSRKLELTEEETAAIIADPLGWLRANVYRVKAIYPEPKKGKG